ncbi:TorF family putative porin [Sphingomonas caeni]|uniref:TorF family putative porin n=1 Tax=Sphingomonas caeni TaxID=2984949 RepID=UPI0022314E75|nr:TorF family putative porin [Sphingomonas caeni]
MITLGGLMLAAATPAMAQDETEPADAVTISGSVTAVTDYRFRGVSQGDQDLAIQGGVTVSHESGLYASVWASTIKGKEAPVVAGYGEVEVDLSAGYTKTFDNGVGVDIGLLYYLYPVDKVSGLDTDFFEPYASLSYTIGPVTTKVGANYAWSGQDGLVGNDSLYLRGDVTVAVPKTPISVLGHLGHTDGQLAFFAPNEKYWDWSLGAEVSHGFAKLGIQYVDTDVPNGTTFGIPKYSKVIGANPGYFAYVTLSF